MAPSDDDQIEVDPSDVSDELDEQSLTDRVAIFLAKLKSVPTQTFTAINFVVQESSSLVSDIVGNLQRKTMLVLQRLGQNETPEVQDLNREFQSASVPFQGLDTEHKQMKYFVESGCFINPVEEPLPGVSYTQKRHPSSGVVQQVPVRDTFQRIPPHPLLTKILETPGTIEKVLETQQSKGDGLRDFRDGDQYKAKSLFSEGLTLPIVLYNDDCETVNPLGSKTGIYKLGLIYFAIRSFPPKLLSSLKSVFLAAVYKSDDAKTYGTDTILIPIVDELKYLELNGIEVHTPTFQGKVRIGVTMKVL